MGTAGREPDVADLTVPDCIPERGGHQFPDLLLFAGLDGDLASAPAEPLSPPPVADRRWSAKWRLALAASCLLHAAAALSFLIPVGEPVLVEGAELSGIAFHGNASEDQMSAGTVAEAREPAVDVTMVTMLQARPVEAVEAEMSPADEIAEPVDVVAMESPVAETVQPASVAVARPVASSSAERAESITAQAAPVAPSERTESVERTAQAPAPGSDQAPHILASDRLEMVEHDAVAQKVIEARPAEPAEVAGTAVQAAVETAEAASGERVGPAAPAQRDSAQAETVSDDTPPATSAEPSAARSGETEFAEASKINEDAASPPLPEPRPRTARPDKQEPVRQKPAKSPAQAERGVKAVGKPAAKAKKAGSGGGDQSDSRRGQSDGREAGQAVSSSKGRKTSAAGNAAVSNYPGKVATRLRRALRYPAAAKRQRLRGQVRVSFVVSAGGGVSGIRVVASSGSSILDDAAIEAVRRAAPFPAIPDSAGRSTWPFTVPLMFSR